MKPSNYRDDIQKSAGRCSRVAPAVGAAFPASLTSNSARRSALRALVKLLRGRFDAIAAEMADAQHFLDEIEAVSGVRPAPTDEEKRR